MPTSAIFAACAALTESGAIHRFERLPIATGLLVLGHAERRLKATRGAVRDAHRRFVDAPETLLDRVLRKAAGQPYYTTSTDTLTEIVADRSEARVERMQRYAASFSSPISVTLKQLDFFDGFERHPDAYDELLAALVEQAPDVRDLDRLWTDATKRWQQPQPEIARILATLACPDGLDGTTEAFDPDCGYGRVLAALARQGAPGSRLIAMGATAQNRAVTASRLLLADRSPEVMESSSGSWTPTPGARLVIASAPKSGQLRQSGPRRWSEFRRVLAPRFDDQLPTLPDERSARAVGHTLAAMHLAGESPARAALLLPAEWMLSDATFADLRGWLARTGWLSQVFVLGAGACEDRPAIRYIFTLDNRRDPSEPIRLVDARDCIDRSSDDEVRIDADEIFRRGERRSGPHVQLLSPGDFGASRKLSRSFSSSLVELQAALTVALRAFYDLDDAFEERPDDPDALAALRRAHHLLGERLTDYAEALDALADGD